MVKSSGPLTPGDKLVIQRINMDSNLQIGSYTARDIFGDSWTLNHQDLGSVYEVVPEVGFYGDHPLPKTGLCPIVGLPEEKKSEVKGFIGSGNLPIDLDWDEYER